MMRTSDLVTNYELVMAAGGARATYESFLQERHRRSQR